MKKTDIKKRPHPPTVFSDEFKIKIITEYLETDLTKREILDKYGIRSNSPIQKWMRKLGIIDPYAKKDYLGVTNFNRLKKVKELEKLLDEEKLKSEMFARVIEIAENDMKLPIRKKYDTK